MKHCKILKYNPRYYGVAVIIIIIIVGLVRVLGASKQETTQPPHLVVLAYAKSQDVPVYLSALGLVTPLETVTVKTQVNGQLLQVLFKEGQMVKKGDVLAIIDSRPYEAQLAQYQGQLARDQALLANAHTDLQRYETLWSQDSVAEQVLATQRSLVRQYQGAIDLDRGLLEGVKVNIGYCSITAPTQGRIGLRLVDQGNIVQTTDTTGLAIINQLNPISVVFSLPENDVTSVTQPFFSGKSLGVLAYDQAQTTLLAQGKLLTIDNQIDPTTGTVKLKAQFDNKDNRLFPNQFVNIKIRIKTLPSAIVIPTSAIQYHTKGTFVYTVNSDQKVISKPVEVGVTSGELTTITSGLVIDQAVVVDGADKLTEGMTVKVVDPPASVKMTPNGKL